VEPTVALAWRAGELAYVREPLGSVIEDLNRYSARKIVIRDPGIAELRFTGTAFASSLEDWLAGVAQAYSLDVEESPAGEIIVGRRE
jgi:transmembrane sensor